MVEAVDVVGTRGECQRISKANTRSSLMLISDRLRPDKKKRGIRYEVEYDYFTFRVGFYREHRYNMANLVKVK